MVDVDLAYLPAAEQATLIANGTLSPVELVDNALAQIAIVNPALNCFAFVWEEEARADAAAAASAVANGAPLGPLHGVPIALKDTTPTAGHITTFGSHAFAEHVPARDAAIVAALRRAGAIIVGKTTTPEFAHWLITDSPLWGPTLNPWDLTRSTGGSSGGSGAAVASGCVALAEGSDMGGSVRIPAAWCGVVGFKPGLGRIPMDVLPGLFDNISHHGPLARCVDDARLFVQVTQGPNDDDIMSLPTSIDLSTRIPGNVKGLRVGLSIDLDCWAVAPEIESALRRTADRLADAGALVSEVHPRIRPDDERNWLKLWQVFMAAYFGHLVPTFGERMSPSLLRLIEAGHALSAVEYKRLEIARTDLWTRLRSVLDLNDVLLCPTMSMMPIGPSFTDPLPSSPNDGRHHSPDMTGVFNLVSPCPAISVPCGVDVHGLPIGAQVVGRRWQEPTVLRVATAIETLSRSADELPRRYRGPTPSDDAASSRL